MPPCTSTLCWGHSVTFHTHRSLGIPQVRWVDLARQYIANPKPWLPLRMESSVCRDLHSHMPQRLGSSSSSPLVYVSEPGLCGEGGLVSGEEGVGAVHHPVASWCVVVCGGEGVVQTVHEGHVCRGGWLLVVGGGDVPRDVVPGVAQGHLVGHPVPGRVDTKGRNRYNDPAPPPATPKSGKGEYGWSGWPRPQSMGGTHIRSPLGG